MQKKIREIIGSISPKMNTQLTFLLRKKKLPNLKNPQTFDEKISYLKLYDYPNNDLVSQCADKIAVRDYITEKGYSDILNEMYAVYDSPLDIDIETLPKEFILKWNHDYNSTYVINDKQTADMDDIIHKLVEKGKDKFYLRGAEYHYKKIKPRILAERKLVEPNVMSLTDYKFYCYKGKVKYVMVCLGRSEEVKFYFYDMEWNLLRNLSKEGKAAPLDFTLEKPKNFDKMVEIASDLSEPFKFVRVDFYNIEGKIYFGEMTFTPSSGVDPDLFLEADILLGKEIDIGDNK